MDSIVGAEYQNGLGKLKALAESTPAPAAAGETLKISEVNVSARDIAYIEGVTDLDPAAISKALGGAYSSIGQFMQAHALRQDGAPLAVNRFYDESGWGFQAAIPVTGVTDAIRADAANSGVVRIGRTYAGRALKGIHIGDHSSLPDAYRALEDYMVVKGLDSNGFSWEQYISDPVTTPREKQQTNVYMPVKTGGAAPGSGAAIESSER
jgi:effector-binding domain-containing protein